MLLAFCRRGFTSLCSRQVINYLVLLSLFIWLKSDFPSLFAIMVFPKLKSWGLVIYLMLHLYYVIIVNYLTKGNYFFFFFFYYSWFTVFYQFLVYSKVTQLYIYTHSFSHIILYHVPSHVISSLCYIAGFHSLSTPHAIVCIY